MGKIVMLSLLALAACEVTPEPFKGPNNRPAYSMRCSGGSRTIVECYNKASDLCPKGYNILGHSNVGIGGVYTGNNVNGFQSGIISGATKETLAVECK